MNDSLLHFQEKKSKPSRGLGTVTGRHSNQLNYRSKFRCKNILFFSIIKLFLMNDSLLRFQEKKSNPSRGLGTVTGRHSNQLNYRSSNESAKV
jgi:hypothetical protein